jgi:hypothetical protein
MNNQYQEKINDYISNMVNIMYTFEVTKCCGYSVFIPLYKTDTLIDLYSRIITHFSASEIKELFFYAPSGERIKIPISKNSIENFVKDNTTCNPMKLVSIYPLPNPVVYRLCFDDGHYCNNCSNNQYITNNNVNNNRSNVI